MLRDLGVPVNPDRLVLSYAAHLITPAHLALDAAREQARGKSMIGTTLRGIGPAYNHIILFLEYLMGNMGMFVIFFEYPLGPPEIDGRPIPPPDLLHGQIENGWVETFFHKAKLYLESHGASTADYLCDLKSLISC